MGNSEALELLGFRQGTYQFLATSYRAEPTAEYLAGLATVLAGEEPGDGTQGLASLRRWAASTPDMEVARLALAGEYARLFLNAAESGIHPYESVYTSPDGLMMGKAYTQVVAIYRQLGLQRVEGFREPEDHLAVEFEFMAHLCARAGEALAAGDTDAFRHSLSVQEDFLRQHLLNWAPRLAGDLERATGSDFYLGLAQLTREFLEHEPETLADLGALAS